MGLHAGEAFSHPPERVGPSTDGIWDCLWRQWSAEQGLILILGYSSSRQDMAKLVDDTISVDFRFAVNDNQLTFRIVDFESSAC